MRSLASVKGTVGWFGMTLAWQAHLFKWNGSELGIKEGGANIKEESNFTTLIILDVSTDQRHKKKPSSWNRFEECYCQVTVPFASRARISQGKVALIRPQVRAQLFNQWFFFVFFFCFFVVSLGDWRRLVNSLISGQAGVDCWGGKKTKQHSSWPKMSNTAGNFNLRARGAACTLVSQVASSGRSGHDMVVTWGWWEVAKKGRCGLILKVYVDWFTGVLTALGNVGWTVTTPASVSSKVIFDQPEFFIQPLL